MALTSEVTGRVLAARSCSGSQGWMRKADFVRKMSTVDDAATATTTIVLGTDSRSMHDTSA